MKNLFVKAMPHTSRNFLTIILAFGLVVSALYGSAAHASATTVPSARFGGPFSSHGTSLSGPFTGHGSSQHPPQGSLVRQPLEPNQAAYLQAKARLNAHVPRGSVSRQGLSQGAVPPVPVSFKGLGQNGGGAPSDSTGAVGTKRYIELVNSQYGIGKLGQICTNFEVKQRKSARMVGIDHSEPGETAPHLVSSITIL